MQELEHCVYLTYLLSVGRHLLSVIDASLTWIPHVLISDELAPNNLVRPRAPYALIYL